VVRWTYRLQVVCQCSEAGWNNRCSVRLRDLVGAGYEICIVLGNLTSKYGNGAIDDEFGCSISVPRFLSA